MGRKGKKKKKQASSDGERDIKENDLQKDVTCTSTNQGSAQMSKESKETIKIEVKPTINVVHKISAEYVQVGENNNMQVEGQGFTGDGDGSNEGACALPISQVENITHRERKLYSDVIASRRAGGLKIVNNITINKLQREEYRSKDPIYQNKQIRNFLDSVNNFRTGHFILMLDKYEHVNNLDALALVPWISVLDFDPHSRSSGILQCTEMKLSKTRSLQIVCIQDKSAVIEHRTNWVFMTGCDDRPDTQINVDFKSWRKNVELHFKSHLQQLCKFGQAYTNFTLIVIWPRESSKWTHIQYAIGMVDEILSPSLVLIDDGHTKEFKENSALECLKNFHEIQEIQLSLQDICNVLTATFSKEEGEQSEIFKFPSHSYLEITEEKAQWLAEDLEVLYSKNLDGLDYDMEKLNQEEDNFFKGGTLPWSLWYRVGSGSLDVERDLMKEILKYIKQQHVRLAKSGIVTLYHAPGSGGTTLAQRILWEMRTEIPCAQVKHRSWASVSDLAAKIDFLSEKTGAPILILFDGEDEQRVDSVQRALKEYCVVILYVKRSTGQPKETKKNHGQFWLTRNISKTEAHVFGFKSVKNCTTAEKREAIKNLVKEIDQGIPRSFFDFGLTLHDHEYKGLKSYVKGYMRLNENETSELQKWQTALAYLSLVYYYGQTSLPCFFLSEVLQSDQILLIDELPIDMKELVVKDFSDGKKNAVRISHYLVAKEILDQVLTRTRQCKITPSPFLSSDAKKLLGKFAIEFIKVSGKINKGNAATMICKTMTRTFITRDNKAVGEHETQTNRNRRPKLSLLLEDVDNQPPYTERFEVLQQLTDSFPKEPQLWAHLGRLYTICRPNEEEEAEKCFKKALEMCSKEIEGMEKEDIPHTKKLDLRNIYHMYGNMYIVRISKYTGKYLGDIPVLNVESSRFCEIGLTLLDLAQTACDLFYQCREITPPGSEESFGYIGEIQVRLMFCDFVNSRSGSKNLHHYTATNDTEIASFIEECYVALDELVVECFSVIEPEKMDNNVRNCQEWFAALFRDPIRGVSNKSHDDVQSRRMEIAKVKMKYSTSKSYGVLDLVDSIDDIRFIVNEYEKNFEVYERVISQHQHDLVDKRPSTRVIDMDYREWLFAIRHCVFPDELRIETVLQHVQSWFDQVHSIHSRFYLFVLKSLLGIGSYRSPGNTELLLQAQELKEDVLKYSKYFAKPRYPREWLGLESRTIRRLIPGKRFFGQLEGRDMHGVDFDSLEIRKGTICRPNDKPAGGFIDLDLGPENRVPVKVFYVPVRAEMKGVSYQGTRVEFVVGFSLSHGYEAFSVKQLKQISCEKCKRKLEFRSCDTEVKCKCQVKYFVKTDPKSSKTYLSTGN